MTSIGQRWRRIASSGLCGPFAVALVSVLLLWHVAAARSVGVPDGAYGPRSWPLFALVLLVCGMALHCALRTRAFIARRSSAQRDSPVDQDSSARRVLIATALIALYGAGFAFAGFLLSTIAFMFAWLVFARYRRPVPLVLISVLGTILPLYLLVKVAFMPLPRGVGVLEEATIQIYQWLHLF
ncbi:MAG: tripartite tricarboxylate transporter TctB family protein [Burkholderiales bacterium]